MDKLVEMVYVLETLTHQILDKYEELKNKHLQLLKFYDFEYNLDELRMNG